jgi:pyrophosphatase PpaX
MAYRGVLFDLDGTLLDSIELIIDSFRHTFGAHFDPPPLEAGYRASLGMPLREFFASVATEAVSCQVLMDTYLAYNLEHHDAMVRSYGGATDTLDALTRRGARLAIVTSKMNPHAWRGLEVTGLARYFEVLVGADDVERGKPDPEPVLRALQVLGLTPAETLFVGDSPHDVVAGHRAGVATAAVLWGPFARAELEAVRPTYWLETLPDLLDLVPAGR